MGSYRVCMCFTRNFTTTEAETPEDIKELFNKYTEGGTYMSADQLYKFLIQVQGESDASLANAERIVDQVLRIRHPIVKFTRHNLSLDDFKHFLFSSTLNPPIGSQVHQDMKAPLSHYYIYTGHNSYLTGNQISSACSELPIIKALQRGVRGVELDLWPSSTKDDVHVLHGRTLTTPVKLIKCLKSIKEYAFSASPYPVIITLEDHLPPHLQSRVAEMITQTFGEMLWYPETEILKEFPSPEELKYRIIISTKLPKEYLQSKILNNIANESQKEKDSENDEWGKEPTELVANKENDNKSESCCGDQSPDDEVNDDSSSESDMPESPEYKLLIAIEVKKRKGGLKKALQLDLDKVRRLSLREQALKKAAEAYSADVVRFTQKNFLRIFPKATRVTSSNYKPLIGWRLGAQMVALNMQGYGRPLWLMHGMFRANGGCGYVKKPDFLMSTGPHGEVFDPKAIYPVKTILKVKVYMGDGWDLDFKQTHFNLYSPPNFYTRVGIAGVTADETMKKTKIRKDNWTPVWNEEFTFPLTVPELALLRIEVYEYNMPEKDDFGGQTCLPISELKQGIRAVPLFDRKGEKYSSPRLLMRFEFV